MATTLAMVASTDAVRGVVFAVIIVAFDPRRFFRK